MNNVKCPNCEKDVSTNDGFCPDCGTVLVEDVPAEKAPEKILCGACGAELKSDFRLCPICGCPVEGADDAGNAQTVAQPLNAEPQKVEIAAVNLGVKKKSKIAIIIAAVAVVFIAVVSVIIGVIVKNVSESNYISNYESTAQLMLDGAADAEKACNLIKNVWYDTIYEEYDSETYEFTHGTYGFHDDFNDALAELFVDDDFVSMIDSIETNQILVASSMKDLQDPPEEYEEAYDALRDFYDAYLEITGLAVNPTGSLTTFSSNFNDADSEAIKSYNEVELYFE